MIRDADQEPDGGILNLPLHMDVQTDLPVQLHQDLTAILRRQQKVTFQVDRHRKLRLQIHEAIEERVIFLKSNLIEPVFHLASLVQIRQCPGFSRMDGAVRNNHDTVRHIPFMHRKIAGFLAKMPAVKRIISVLIFRMLLPHMPLLTEQASQLFIRFPVQPAAHRLMMVQHYIIAHHMVKPKGRQVQAQVNVIVSDMQLLIHSADLPVMLRRDHQARAGHREAVIIQKIPAIIIDIPVVLPLQDVGRPVPPVDNPVMLDARGIRVEQLRPDGTGMRLHRLPRHPAQPVILRHLNIIIQEQNILSPRQPGPDVAHPREVKFHFLVMVTDTVFLRKARNLFPVLAAAAVINQDDLIIRIIRMPPDGPYALRQDLHIVLGGNDNAHQRRADTIINDTILVHLLNKFRLCADSPAQKCLRLRTLICNQSIRLRLGSRRGGFLPLTPVIQHLRDMPDPGIVRKLQEAERKIIILRPVKLRTQSAGLFHQLRTVYRQMVGVHHGEKCIRRPVRLEEWVVPQRAVL